MSKHKTVAVAFLGGLILVVLLGASQLVVFAETSFSGQLVSSPESFGHPNGCITSQGGVVALGAPCPQVQGTGSCSSAQQICKKIIGGNGCQYVSSYKAEGDICKQGEGCTLDSRCDATGSCRPGEAVTPTDCKYGEVRPAQIPCGQSYTVNINVVTDAACGGKPCPSSRTEMGPACQPTAIPTDTPTDTPTATPTDIPTAIPTPKPDTCACGYTVDANPSVPDGILLCKTVCADVGSSISYYNQAGYCTCSGMPLKPCPSSASGKVLNVIGTFPQSECAAPPTQCSPIPPDACGAGCKQAAYPDCKITCEGECKFRGPFTYYTYDGQCMEAVTWGPSEGCCGNIGCFVNIRGYGGVRDEMDYEPYQPYNVVAWLAGSTNDEDLKTYKCYSCDPEGCSSTTDCIKDGTGGKGEPPLKFGFYPGQIRYGRMVMRHPDGTKDAVETAKQENMCHCVQNKNSCPKGYTMESSKLEIEYTSIYRAGVMDGVYKTDLLGDVACGGKLGIEGMPPRIEHGDDQIP